MGKDEFYQAVGLEPPAPVPGTGTLTPSVSNLAEQVSAIAGQVNLLLERVDAIEKRIEVGVDVSDLMNPIEDRLAKYEAALGRLDERLGRLDKALEDPGSSLKSIYRKHKAKKESEGANPSDDVELVEDAHVDKAEKTTAKDKEEHNTTSLCPNCNKDVGWEGLQLLHPMFGSYNRECPECGHQEEASEQDIAALPWYRRPAIRLA